MQRYILSFLVVCMAISLNATPTDFPKWLKSNYVTKSINIYQVFGKVEKLRAKVDPTLSNIHALAHGKDYYYLTILLLEKNQNGHLSPIEMPIAAYVSKEDYNKSRILGKIRILSNQNSIYISSPSNIFFACLDLNIFFDINGFDDKTREISFYLAISTANTKLLTHQKIVLGSIFEIKENSALHSGVNQQKFSTKDAEKLFLELKPSICKKCELFEKSSEKEYPLKKWFQEDHSNCVKTKLIGIATDTVP